MSACYLDRGLTHEIDEIEHLWRGEKVGFSGFSAFSHRLTSPETCSITWNNANTVMKALESPPNDINPPRPFVFVFLFHSSTLSFKRGYVAKEPSFLCLVTQKCYTLCQLLPFFLPLSPSLGSSGLWPRLRTHFNRTQAPFFMYFYVYTL